MSDRDACAGCRTTDPLNFWHDDDHYCCLCQEDLIKEAKEQEDLRSPW